MKIITAALLSLALTAHASEQEGIASHVADLATTAIALDMPGVVEGNPLGIGLIPIKVLMYREIKAMPPDQQERGWHMFAAFGWGATANNLCVIAAMHPGCLVVGLATGMYRWYSGEAKWEREQFDKLCAEARSANPALVCEWVVKAN